MISTYIPLLAYPSSSSKFDSLLEDFIFKACSMLKCLCILSISRGVKYIVDLDKLNWVRICETTLNTPDQQHVDLKAPLSSL